MFNPLTLFLYTKGSCTSAKPVCNLLIKWLNKELASLQCCKLISVTWRLADAITILMVLPPPHSKKSHPALGWVTQMSPSEFQVGSTSQGS